jgi:hypothetical protein
MELNIDGLRGRLQDEYLRYDEIMQAMPKAMDSMEHKRAIAKADCQRGRLEGLELALNILEGRARA